MAKPPPFFIQLLNALDGSDLSVNARAVLVAQFKFATHATGRDSRPSEARLMEFLGPDMSQSRLRRARKELRDKGWLIERKRGHNGKTEDSASMYDVVIPPARVPARPKPKRATNNPGGYNGRKKKFEVTGDLKLEVKSSSFPSKFEVTGDHLPGEPLRGSKDHSLMNEEQELVSTEESPRVPGLSSGSADADREGAGDSVAGVKRMARHLLVGCDACRKTLDSECRVTADNRWFCIGCWSDPFGSDQIFRIEVVDVLVSEPAVKGDPWAGNPEEVPGDPVVGQEQSSARRSPDGLVDDDYLSAVMSENVEICDIPESDAWESYEAPEDPWVAA